MPQFQIGDDVQLTHPPTNGSSAYQTFTLGMRLKVENVSAKCSTCVQLPHNGTVKINGRYYCAEAFEPYGTKRAAPAVAGSGATAVGVAVRRTDPAKRLYSSDADFWDTLPDPTLEEYHKLPSYQQLEDEWKKKMGWK